MKKYLLSAIIVLLSVYSFAQSAITSSSVTYEVKNMGINITGKFGGLAAAIKFDPSKLEASSIEAAIDVNSVNSDNETRDNHLKGEKFFDAAHYPKITLKSLSFQRKSGNNYLGKFNLSIKGITKPVDLPFTYTQANGKATYNGSFKLKRQDYNVGGSSMVLADDVTVFIVVVSGE